MLFRSAVLIAAMEGLFDDMAEPAMAAASNALRRAVRSGDGETRDLIASGQRLDEAGRAQIVDMARAAIAEDTNGRDT